MGYLDDLLSLVGLYGKPEGAPQPQPPHTPTPATAYGVSEAPPLASYPSTVDAYNAQRGGFGYGEPYSAYIEGTAGRIFGDKKGPLPVEGRGANPSTQHDIAVAAQTTPTTQKVSDEMRGRMRNAYTRAALAVNHSPVAAVGFDPRNMTLDVTGETKVPSVQGMTSPSTGQMYVQMPPGYVDADNASTIVHESIHNGLQRLLSDKSMAIPPELRDRIVVDNESLVRQLMKLQAGDPEEGEHVEAQRQAGRQWTPDEIGILNKLAQEAIRLRRPYGGPR